MQLLSLGRIFRNVFSIKLIIQRQLLTYSLSKITYGEEKEQYHLT